MNRPFDNALSAADFPQWSRLVTQQSDRAFLFLQGPPGPLFRRLGQSLSEKGLQVHRINICGGDRYDWADGAVDFRGRFSEWPVFLDTFLRTHGITDLILFGDCRPYHVSAHGMAALRGVRTHVLEEGYLRPDWMTFEPEGVNARSSLSRDKGWFLREAERLPAAPELPTITASFPRRARDSYWYYHYATFSRLRYPHYRSHRPGSITLEALGWVWKLIRQRARRRAADAVLRGLEGKPLFLFPLQLSGDFQIRAHSPFPDMRSAATYVIESFAAHAPDDLHLLVKAHPLDCSFFPWGTFIRRHAQRLGIDGRLHFLDGHELTDIVRMASGMVCVNSTSATLALAEDIPVCTIGEAIYDIPGLTHQGHLDSFWANPTAPEPGVYPAFRRVLVDRCLVRGGLASESAVSELTDSLLQRLLAPPAALRAIAEPSESGSPSRASRTARSA